MKKMNVYLGLLLVIGVAFGCKKDPFEDDNGTLIQQFRSSGVSNQGGVLSFSCYSDFISTIEAFDSLVNVNASDTAFDELKVFESFEIAHDFLSMRQVLESQQLTWELDLTTSTYDDFENSPIATSKFVDEAYMSCLSPEGLVYISGVLIKFISEDEVIQVVDPVPSDIVTLAGISDLFDGHTGGDRFLAEDLGVENRDSVLIRHTSTSNQFRFFAPELVGCNITWNGNIYIQGSPVTSHFDISPSSVVTLPPGAKYIGTVTYDYGGNSYSRPVEFKAPSVCSDIDPYLKPLQGSLYECVSIKFLWEIPAVNNGTLEPTSALLDFGDGNFESVDITSSNPTNTFYHEYSADPTSVPKLTFFFNAYAPGSANDPQLDVPALQALLENADESGFVDGVCVKTVDFDGGIEQFNELGLTFSLEDCCLSRDGKWKSSIKKMFKSEKWDDDKKYVSVGGKMFNTWRDRTRLVVKGRAFKKRNSGNNFKRHRRYMRLHVIGELAISGDDDQSGLTLPCVLTASIPDSDAITNYVTKKRKTIRQGVFYKSTKLFAGQSIPNLELVVMSAKHETLSFICADFGKDEPNDKTIDLSLSNSEIEVGATRLGPVNSN